MAVSDGARLLAGCRLLAEAAHSELIVKTASELIAAAGFSPREIQKVAAVAGPGSFTGIRIGLTFARTISRALDIPAVAISAFDACALSAAVPPENKRNLDVPRDRRSVKKAGFVADKIMVVIDALFPLVHWAVYDSSGQKKIAGPGLDNVETVSARFAPSGKSSERWTFAGSAMAVDKTRSILSEYFGRAASTLSFRYVAPTPAALVALAATSRGGCCKKTLKPLYLKEVYLRK